MSSTSHPPRGRGPAPAAAAAPTATTAVAGWARDPVCREWIHVATAAATAAEHDGQVFHFCDARCRERFLSEPERFSGAHA